MKLIKTLLLITFLSTPQIVNSSPSPKITELACLSSAIYYESIGEPYAGKVAVAQAIIERIKHPVYPNTVCTVISEYQQFPWFNKINLPIKVFDETREIAENVLTGKTKIKPAQGATHFHSVKVKPTWAKKMIHVKTIGNHRFYKENGKRK